MRAPARCSIGEPRGIIIFFCGTAAFSRRVDDSAIYKIKDEGTIEEFSERVDPPDKFLDKTHGETRRSPRSNEFMRVVLNVNVHVIARDRV